VDPLPADDKTEDVAVLLLEDEVGWITVLGRPPVDPFPAVEAAEEEALLAREDVGRTTVPGIPPVDPLPAAWLRVEDVTALILDEDVG
jgi:hypothetical protein